MVGFSFIQNNNTPPGRVGVGLSSIVGPTGAIGPTGAQALTTGMLDAFGRFRVSNPYTLFDSQNRYKLNNSFDTYATGAGANITYSTGTSTVLLNVGTTATNHVLRETYKVFPYQPGKSLLVMNSFMFNPAKAGLVQQVGYYGSNNGIYLKQDGSSVYIVKRVEGTGDILIPQASWNCDPLNGTGYSGITLDLTKSQILFIDFEWLGVGSVRVGFLINGQYVYAHIFDYANIGYSTYMTTACLPIRYEIYNTSVTSSSSTLTQICSTVISEGGYQGTSLKRYATTSTSTTNVSTSLTPIISIRLRSDRLDAIVLPSQVDMIVTSNSTIQYSLIYNGTVTGGTWVQYGTGSNVEYNITPNTISGGQSIDQAYLSSNSQTKSTLSGNSFEYDLTLGRTLSGVSDTITLCAISFSGTATVAASLGWVELI